MADNICKGKRYIKAICDKYIKLPYCKPTEKPKFKDLQKLLNGALLKRISAVEKIAEGMGECNTAKDIAVCTFMKRFSAVETEHKTLIRLLPSRVREIQEGWCCGVDNRLDDLFDKVEKLEARIEEFEPTKDVQEWVCTTRSKKCKGQDPCYFNELRTRCPMYGFVITFKEAGEPWQRQTHNG